MLKLILMFELTEIKKLKQKLTPVWYQTGLEGKLTKNLIYIKIIVLCCYGVSINGYLKKYLQQKKQNKKKRVYYLVYNKIKLMSCFFYLKGIHFCEYLRHNIRFIRL